MAAAAAATDSLPTSDITESAVDDGDLTGDEQGRTATADNWNKLISDTQQKLAELCTEYNELLECEKEPNGLPKVDGHLGLATLRNDGGTVELYRNCAVLSSGHGVDYSNRCRVSSSAVAVAVKVLTTEDSARALRQAASLAPQVTVGFYDIQDLSTKTPHRVHQSFAFLDRHSGIDGVQLLNQFIEPVEEASLRSNLIAIVKKYIPVMSNIDAGVTENDDLINEVNRSIKRAVNELWLRARYRLSFLDSILEALEHQLSVGLFHCSLSLKSVMFRPTNVMTPQDLQNFISNGSAATDVSVYYSSPRGNTALIHPSIFAENSRITVFQFGMPKSGLTDYDMSVSFADIPHFPVAALMDGKLDEADNVDAPCRTQRTAGKWPNATDDVAALQPLIDATLLGLRGYLLPRFQAVKEYARQRRPKTTEALFSDTKVVELLGQLSAAVEQRDVFFTTTWNLLVAVPEYGQCVEYDKESLDGVENAKRVAKCSVGTMMRAVLGLRLALRRQAAALRDQIFVSVQQLGSTSQGGVGILAKQFRVHMCGRPIGPPSRRAVGTNEVLKQTVRKLPKFIVPRVEKVYPPVTPRQQRRRRVITTITTTTGHPQAAPYSCFGSWMITPACRAYTNEAYQSGAANLLFNHIQQCVPSVPCVVQNVMITRQPPYTVSTAPFMAAAVVNNKSRHGPSPISFHPRPYNMRRVKRSTEDITVT